MTSWYKHGAVLAAWLGLVLTAQAQQVGFPSPVGAARMIEPLGYTPKPQPPLVPGPITPEMAPLGPPDALSLSGSHPSAFQCEEFPREVAFYGSLGAQALQRYRIGHVNTVFVDPNGGLDTVNVPNPLTVRSVQDFNSINAPMLAGPRLTVGYLEGNQAWEFAGFYLPQQERSLASVGQANLLVPFPGPRQGVPRGFEGNNGLWLNADLVRSFYRNQIGSAEFNYRLSNSGFNHVELILGLRYFSLKETAGIFTQDDLFIVNALGQPDACRSATYTADVNSNFVTAQFGGEFSTPCPIPYFGWIWFTGIGKSAIGGNLFERTFTLRRGDGFVGFKRTRFDVHFAGIYEVGAYLDLHLLERLRLRAGYQGICLVGLSDAVGQINFDLRNPLGRSAGYTTEFYHGPMLELQFLF